MFWIGLSLSLWLTPESSVFLVSRSRAGEKTKFFDTKPNKFYFLSIAILRSAPMKNIRFLKISSFSMFSCNFVYFGLLWNGGALSSNPFLNVFYLGLLGTVGALLQKPLLNFISSIKIVAFSFYSCATVIFLAIMIGDEGWTSILCFFGFFWICLTYINTYDAAATFPVNNRSISCSICSLLARSANFTPPFMKYLSPKMQLGTLVIISAASASFYLILPYIPEEMPFFTMSEANKVYKETYFSGKKYSKARKTVELEKAWIAESDFNINYIHKNAPICLQDFIHFFYLNLA